MSIKLRIHAQVRKLVPELRIASVLVGGDQTKLASQAEEILATAIHDLPESVPQPDLLAQQPWIAAWRKIYSEMGLKSSEHRSSVESLVRRALKSPDAIPLHIPLVDLYNATSIRSRLPAGGYDLGKLGTAQIDLRLAEPDSDTFTPLGGEARKFPLSPRTIVYAAENKVLCWGINCRDSLHHCIGPETTSAVFFFESPNDAVGDPRVAAESFASVVSGLGVDADVGRDVVIEEKAA